MTRKCRVCATEKPFNYLCLNSQGAAVYVDDNNRIWKGRMCYECHKASVVKAQGKQPLTTVECPTCGKSFKQRQAKHRWCSRKCYGK